MTIEYNGTCVFHFVKDCHIGSLYPLPKIPFPCAWMRAQPEGQTPCLLLTRVQSQASHKVPWTPPGVIPEHRQAWPPIKRLPKVLILPPIKKNESSYCHTSSPAFIGANVLAFGTCNKKAVVSCFNLHFHNVWCQVSIGRLVCHLCIFSEISCLEFIYLNQVIL